MSDRATPVLGAALTAAGSGGLFDDTALSGALMLLAYAIGRSPFLVLAGLAPQGIGSRAQRLGPVARVHPGQRAFSVAMMPAGGWLIYQSGILPARTWGTTADEIMPRMTKRNGPNSAMDVRENT